MCGIFGIISRHKKGITQDILERGIKKVQHRGPDGNGYFISEDVGLAACRLAIMDKTTASAQPFKKHNLVLVFNGAIYNDKALKIELEELGATFQTTGDTEVVLEAFHYWGAACLDRFNGMWAIAIYNQTTTSMFLARDRYGIKPLYYMVGAEHVAFASEIKAFSTLSDWSPRANKEVLGQYLAYGMQDYCSQTMFETVMHIPAAHYAVFNTAEGRFKLQQYYTLTEEQIDKIDPQEAIEEFSRLFDEAIQMRQRCVVPVGASLSGGIDSSSIVCRAARNQHSVSTFSIIYPGSAIDESTYVHDVNQLTAARSHTQSPPLDDLWSQLDTIIYTQDEPISSASVCAQHVLYRDVSHTPVKVILDGQGADELLGGYEAFLASAFHNKNGLIDKGQFLIDAARHAGLSVSTSFDRITARRQKTGSGQADWLRIKLNQHKYIPDVDTTSTSRRLLREMGLPVLLHYADRNSMAYGIETRVPFLDHRLVDFCMSLPDDLKIRQGHRKWLLKESGKDILPASVYHRKDKIGFETPQKKWMKKNRAFLNDQAINYAQLMETIINPHDLKGKLSDAHLWRIICAGKWVSLFNIGINS